VDYRAQEVVLWVWLARVVHLECHVLHLRPVDRCQRVPLLVAWVALLVSDMVVMLKNMNIIERAKKREKRCIRNGNAMKRWRTVVLLAYRVNIIINPSTILGTLIVMKLTRNANIGITRFVAVMVR